MTQRVAIQMDALATIDPAKDTTYVLALEAQARGHQLFYYTPDKLFMEDGRLFADLYPVTFHHGGSPFFTLGEVKRSVLADEIDIILMRQDPPFDMNYLTYCYLLDSIKEHCLVINDPMQVVNCPEKIFATVFAELMPPTMISRSESVLAEFRHKHHDIVLKPLYAHGGKDVFRIQDGDVNFSGIIEMLERSYQCPMIAQRFEPAIFETGDKRIILIDGEPMGAIARLPKSGGVRSNMVAGGAAHKTELDADDLRICEALKPELKARGLLLTGIDVIGGKLTEINVTSPTGIQPINRLNQVKLEADFWDVVERKHLKAQS